MSSSLSPPQVGGLEGPIASVLNQRGIRAAGEGAGTSPLCELSSG